MAMNDAINLPRFALPAVIALLATTAHAEPFLTRNQNPLLAL